MPVFTSSIEVTADYPTIKPSLNLNFARSRSLDPRITFTRASVGTYVGRDGLIKTAGVDEARFDHDPDTLESLGLLIEESRTNIVNNNSNVGSWNNASTSQETANPIKGLYTHRVIDVGNDGDSPWLSGSNYTTGTVTMSMYIDAVNSTSDTVTMYLFGGGYISTTWTLTTGVPIHNGGFSINGVNHSNGRVQTIDCGGGIYRLVLTADYSGGTTASRFYITPSNTDTGYVIVAGMQMEQGSFPTSYIPTAGSAVTRSADVASITGTNFSSWYNPTEVSVIGEYSSAQYQGNLTPASYPSPFAIDNNSTTRLVMFYHRYDNQLNAFVRSGAGETVADLNIYSPATSLDYSNIKFGFATSNDGLSGIVNDGNIVTDATVNMPLDVNRVVIGGGYGANPFAICGSVKYLRFYTKKLSDTQLQQLIQ
jgi:hypothetical protein